jgi:hypothetical protein
MSCGEANGIDATTRGSTGWANRSLARHCHSCRCCAERQAGIAEAGLIADQRPWVSFDISRLTLLSGIDYDVNGARFTIRFVIKNTGKTPATGVWIHTFSYTFIPDGPAPANKKG